MINLDDLRLADLLPSSIMGDAAVQAMAAALDNELQSISRSINEIVMLPRIDELSGDIVDSLAWQFHVDFYEPLGLDLDKRRQLVKNALIWHRHKGTKSVLVEIIRILFFESFSVEEWFEYGGEPYFFRLIINDDLESKEKFDDLIRAVYELKNVRSWLEVIKLRRISECFIYLGLALRRKQRYGVGYDRPPGIGLEPAPIYTGVYGKHTGHFTIPVQYERIDVEPLDISIGLRVKYTRHFTIPLQEKPAIVMPDLAYAGIAIRHSKRFVIGSELDFIQGVINQGLVLKHKKRFAILAPDKPSIPASTVVIGQMLRHTRHFEISYEGREQDGSIQE